MELKNNIIWLKAVERKHPPLFMDFLLYGQAKEHFLKATVLNFAFKNVKKVELGLYFDKNETGALREIMKEKLLQEGPDFFKNYADKCYKQSELLLEVCKRISTLDKIKVLNNTEISNLFKEYTEEIFKMSSFLLSIIVAQGVLEGEIKSGLDKILASKEKTAFLDNYKRILTIPARETFEIEDMREIIKIGAEVQKDTRTVKLFKDSSERIEANLPQVAPKLYSIIQNYVEKFGWLKPMYYRGEPATPKDVIRRVKTALKKDCNQELMKTEKAKREAEEKYHQALIELDISGDLLSIIEIIREFLYLRTYRLEVFFIANHYIKNLMIELACRLAISYDDILFLTHKEILSCLEKGISPDLNLIKERKEGFAVIMINGEITWYSGENLQKLLEVERVYHKPRDEIKGVIASPGKVQGRVKIVLTNDDIPKVQEGDILVSTMTTPSLMEAVEKAAAIVTNEGGMLCHAAIVSRELGIPCIIGTEIATEIFQDNDFVEVDADKEGKAKLLQRSV